MAGRLWCNMLSRPADGATNIHPYPEHWQNAKPACFYFRSSRCKQKDIPPLETAAENMTKLELLNVFLNDRLTAVAEEIFRAVKDTVAEYQSEILRSREENERLKRLLNVAVQRLLLQPGEDRWSGECLFCCGALSVMSTGVLNGRPILF